MGYVFFAEKNILFLINHLELPDQGKGEAGHGRVSGQAAPLVCSVAALREVGELPSEMILFIVLFFAFRCRFGKWYLHSSFNSR